MKRARPVSMRARRPVDSGRADAFVAQGRLPLLHREAFPGVFVQFCLGRPSEMEPRTPHQPKNALCNERTPHKAARGEVLRHLRTGLRATSTECTGPPHTHTDTLFPLEP